MIINIKTSYFIFMKRVFESYNDSLLEKEFKEALRKKDKQAVSAYEIGRVHIIDPKFVYKWAIKHEIDLVINFDALSNKSNNIAISNDIFKNRVRNTKSLLK